MSRGFKWLCVGLALSVALNLFFLGGFVYAKFYGPPHHVFAGKGPPGGPRSIDDLGKELALDERQVGSLRQLFGELRRVNEARVKELRDLRENLVIEIRKPQPDVVAVERAIDRAAALRAEMQKVAFKMSNDFAATLPPEQQEKFRRGMAVRMVAVAGNPPTRRGDGHKGEGPKGDGARRESK
jgi:Spy/CpxP family protein refolding chaperone